jgi:hypothetical protein
MDSPRKSKIKFLIGNKAGIKRSVFPIGNIGAYRASLLPFGNMLAEDAAGAALVY